MPLLKSAKKKQGQDVKRTFRNRKLYTEMHRLMKSFEKLAATDEAKAQALLKEVYAKIDKAAKNKIIHANKASRKKSQMAKLLTAKPKAKTASKAKATKAKKAE